MNRRDLLKKILKPLNRLIKQAMLDGDVKAFHHYNDIWMKEFNNYQAGAGRYA